MTKKGAVHVNCIVVEGAMKKGTPSPRPRRLEVDGKTVNASDRFEAGLLRGPCRFRAFSVTGPGLSGRSEVPCDGLEKARFLLSPESGGRHLVYASTPLETACITARTFKVYDLLQEEMA